MSNNTYRFEKQSIYLNGVKGNLITHYFLHRNALGGFDWHKESVTFERSGDNEKPEKSYSIRDKQRCYLNGVSSTIFLVFEICGDAEYYLGTGSVKSKGFARNSTCIKAWLMNE